MPGDVHMQLVALGERWLKRQGFAVVAAELVTRGTPEQADAIGFRSNCSAVIEAKASRADFLADSQKPHRVAGGLGVYRFYLCPEDVIRVDDLPAGWGLLYAVGRSVVEVLRPRTTCGRRSGLPSAIGLHFSTGLMPTRKGACSTQSPVADHFRGRTNDTSRCCRMPRERTAALRAATMNWPSKCASCRLNWLLPMRRNRRTDYVLLFAGSWLSNAGYPHFGRATSDVGNGARGRLCRLMAY